MLVEREDQLASLVPPLFAMRLVTVHVSSVLPTWIWSLWSHHRPEFWRSILPLEKKLAFLTVSTAAASLVLIWDYILTFRMEVDLVWESKWNFMKGLYLFQCYMPFIDSIWFFLYRQSHISPIFLCSFFLRSNRDKSDRGYVLEAIFRNWRFVKSPSPHRPKVQGTHFVFSVGSHCGQCIREQVQPYTPGSGGTIGIYQWSSHYGHGLCGIGTRNCPLFFRFF